jgi:hypothetical protein
MLSVHWAHGRGSRGTRQREHYKERNQQVAMGSHELEWLERPSEPGRASCRLERDCSGRLERQEQAHL